MADIVLLFLFLADTRTFSMKKSIFEAAQLVSFAAGVTLFVYLLQKTVVSIFITEPRTAQHTRLSKRACSRPNMRDGCVALTL
jgi:hypothetical protein